jgi:molybdopterin synthase catalytic subunit
MFLVTEQPLDARRVEEAVAHAGAGAICTFTGTVRDNSAGAPTEHLEYEAYDQMAVAELERIGAELCARWPVARVAISHRIGRLEIGEASVVIAVSAPHRADAIEACHWAIDVLKERVPIWKKEFTPDGSHWVEGPGEHHSAPPGAAFSPRAGQRQL